MVVARADCPARRVPDGAPVTIPRDTFLTLTQALGGNYTLTWQGRMVRVDGADAGALGLEPQKLDFSAPADGRIDEQQLWRALGTVYDPEIPVDLVNLGLIYRLEVDQERARVSVEMTLTAPTCGMGPVLVGDVERRLSLVPHVGEVAVELVFDPPWRREMMSEQAQLETGLFF